MNLATRIALAVGMVSTFALMVLGGSSYMLVHDRTMQAEQVKLDLSARDVALRAEARLRQRIGSVEVLSRNIVIRNSLLDSVGREIYVRPILEDFSSVDNQSALLNLLDYRGRPVIDFKKEASVPSNLQNWYRERAETGTAGAQALMRGEVVEYLLAAYPVLLPTTQTVEGSLVLRLSTDAILRKIGVPGNTYRISLGSARSQDAGPPDTNILITPLKLPPPLDALGLTLESKIDRGNIDHALSRLRLLYFAFGAALVIAVVVLSIWAARRVTQPIRTLAETAKRISSQGLEASLVEFPRGSSGEVAVLEESLARMLERLREGAVLQRNSLQLQFRALFNGMADGVLIVDKQCVIQSANPSACELLGDESANLIGRGMMDFFQPTDGVAQSGRTWGTDDMSSILKSFREITARRKGGGVVPVDWSCGEFSAEGVLVLCQTLCDDSRLLFQGRIDHGQTDAI